MDLSNEQGEASTNNVRPHIKRPLNAYMLWHQEQRNKIFAKTKLSQPEVSKYLGLEWRKLSVESKRPYIEEANRLKEQHMTDHPDYKYSPRRREKSGTFQQLTMVPAAHVESPSDPRAGMAAQSESNKTVDFRSRPYTIPYTGYSNADRYREHASPIPANTSQSFTNPFMFRPNYSMVYPAHQQQQFLTKYHEPLPPAYQQQQFLMKHQQPLPAAHGYYPNVARANPVPIAESKSQLSGYNVKFKPSSLPTATSFATYRANWISLPISTVNHDETPFDLSIKSGDRVRTPPSESPSPEMKLNNKYLSPTKENECPNSSQCSHSI